MEIISKRQVITNVRYGLEFENIEGGGGYSFDCDEDGNLLPLAYEAARANYEYCILTEGIVVIAKGVRKYEWDYTQPAIGKCCCGREVELSNFTNTCECNRDYNSSGDLLAPRSQWGEDTGEYPSDILRIP